MTAATFDTLKSVRRLRDDETFTPQQAERLADALSEAVRDDIATRQDVDQVRTELSAVKTELKAEIAELRTELKAEIAALRTELKGDIAALRAEVKADMADMKAELLKWMLGAVGFQTLVILAAVIALIRVMHP